MRLDKRIRQTISDIEASPIVEYGLNPNYWNEYLFLAFKEFQENAIFLSRVPDNLESLPQKHVVRENLCG